MDTGGQHAALRAGQLGTSFSSSIIAQTSFDLVFGAAKAKPLNLSTTYGWTLHNVALEPFMLNGQNPFTVLASITGSGTIVVAPSGAVSRATGLVRFRLLVTKSKIAKHVGWHSLDLKVLSAGAYKSVVVATQPVSSQLMRSDTGVASVPNRTCSG